MPLVLRDALLVHQKRRSCHHGRSFAAQSRASLGSGGGVLRQLAIDMIAIAARRKLASPVGHHIVRIENALSCILVQFAWKDFLFIEYFVTG